MDKKFNSLKRAISDHPRLFVICLVIILIFVVMIIFRIADKYMNKNEITNEKFYDFVVNEKIEFDAEVNINRKGVINDLVPSINISFSSNPIYSEKKVLFPKETIIVLPRENYMEFKLYPYTYINKEDKKLITVDFNKVLEHYLIYDGSDMFFFSDAGTLMIGDSKVGISKYSIVWCSQKTVKYYNYEEDKIVSVNSTDDVLFENEYYQVDLRNDTIGSEENILSSDTKYLDLISKY